MYVCHSVYCIHTQPPIMYHSRGPRGYLMYALAHGLEYIIRYILSNNGTKRSRYNALSVMSTKSVTTFPKTAHNTITFLKQRYGSP